MVRRDASELRRQRIQAIDKMLQGTGKVNLTKTLALIQYKHGITKQTALTYLEVLQDLGKIVIHSDENIIEEIAE